MKKLLKASMLILSIITFLITACIFVYMLVSIHIDEDLFWYGAAICGYITTIILVVVIAFGVLPKKEK